MKRPIVIMSLVLLTALFLVGQLKAIEIFVWEHDNRQRAQDPVFNASLTATQSVMRTLDGLDVDYDHHTALPDDLNAYDVVMVCLGWYCPG